MKRIILILPLFLILTSCNYKGTFSSRNYLSLFAIGISVESKKMEVGEINFKVGYGHYDMNEETRSRYADDIFNLQFSSLFIDKDSNEGVKKVLYESTMPEGFLDNEYLVQTSNQSIFSDICFTKFIDIEIDFKECNCSRGELEVMLDQESQNDTYRKSTVTGMVFNIKRNMIIFS